MAAVIVIFTVIGLAIGQPVAMLFLLAFLQFLIAVPGCVYSTQRVGLFFFAYLGAQVATGFCEVTWFIVHVAGGGTWPAAVTLAILAIIQAFSVILALTCGEKPVAKKKNHSEIQMKFETTGAKLSRSDVEKATKTSSSSHKASDHSKKKKTIKVKKHDETTTNGDQSNKSQEESSKRSQHDSLDMQSTQPTNTQLSPTYKRVPTMQTGQKRVKEIKKLIAEINAKEQNSMAAATNTASSEIR